MCVVVDVKHKAQVKTTAASAARLQNLANHKKQVVIVSTNFLFCNLVVNFQQSFVIHGKWLCDYDEGICTSCIWNTAIRKLSSLMLFLVDSFARTHIVRVAKNGESRKNTRLYERRPKNYLGLSCAHKREDCCVAWLAMIMVWFSSDGSRTPLYTFLQLFVSDTDDFDGMESVRNVVSVAVVHCLPGANKHQRRQAMDWRPFMATIAWVVFSGTRFAPFPGECGTWPRHNLKGLFFSWLRRHAYFMLHLEQLGKAWISSDLVIIYRLKYPL